MYYWCEILQLEGGLPMKICNNCKRIQPDSATICSNCGRTSLREILIDIDELDENVIVTKKRERKKRLSL